MGVDLPPRLVGSRVASLLHDTIACMLIDIVTLTNHFTTFVKIDPRLIVFHLSFYSFWKICSFCILLRRAKQACMLLELVATTAFLPIWEFYSQKDNLKVYL